MTVTEAQRIINDYYRITNPDEDDQFMYTEALNYLIEETKESDYMTELGGFYYENKRFELALKYYEMAAEYGSLPAIVGLGYIWYYGRTGTRDYEKAFYYYDKARQMGDLSSEYKIADMYRNGYYVKKDEEKYKEIIRSMLPEVKGLRNCFMPVPEVYTRMARIYTEEGKTKEAIELYEKARIYLSQRIQIHPFFGDLNILNWMIQDYYQLCPFSVENMDIYDLYYIFRQEAIVRFTFDSKRYEVRGEKEENNIAIYFEGVWYHTISEFFQKAELEGELLTARYQECRDFEVEYGTDSST